MKKYSVFEIETFELHWKCNEKVLSQIYYGNKYFRGFKINLEKYKTSQESWTHGHETFQFFRWKYRTDYYTLQNLLLA